jgi:hypothetical protein
MPRSLPGCKPDLSVGGLRAARVLKRIDRQSLRLFVGVEEECLVEDSGGWNSREILSDFRREVFKAKSSGSGRRVKSDRLVAVVTEEVELVERARCARVFQFVLFDFCKDGINRALHHQLMAVLATG